MKNVLLKFNKGYYYSILISLTQVILKLGRGLLIPKILVDVSGYGLFSSAALYLRYFMLSDLGAKSYATREVAPLIGKDKDGVEMVLGRALTFSLMTSVVVSVLLLLFINVAHFENSFYYTALYLLIPIFIFAKIREFVLGVANATLNYRLQSGIFFLFNLLSFIFSVLGVYFYGALGGVVGILLSEVILFLLLYKKLTVPLVFDRSIFKNIKGQFKVFFISFSELLSQTFDSIFILSLLSISQFGHYSFAMAISWGFIALSGILITVVVPKMNMQINQPGEVLEMGAKMLFIYFVVAMVIQVPVYIFMKLLTTYYLPNYAEYLKVFPFILLLGLLRAANQILRSLYNSLRREIEYVKKTVFLLFIVFFAGSYFHLTSGKIAFENVVVILSLPELIFFVLLISPKVRLNKFFSFGLWYAAFCCGICIICFFLEGSFESTYGIFLVLSILNLVLGLLLLNNTRNELKVIVS